MTGRSTRLTSIIDAHAHVVPADFPPNPIPAASTRWPQMCCGVNNHRTVTLGKRPFRTLSPNAWDTSVRLDEMDATNVAAQVLSPMPELLSYWLTIKQTASLARHVNATIASMVATAPNRFFGLGTVTLQDPHLAAREVGTLRKEYGLHGVEAGSNVNGVPLGDSRFDPFFQALVEADLCLFVHALHPTTDRLCGPPLMEALVGFPGEIASAVSSFIVHGVLGKFPALRVAFSHGGGSFPMILPRLQHGWEVAQDMRQAIRQSPREQAAHFYFDTLVYHPAALEFLITTYGASRLLVGSDYPFLIQERNPKGFLDSAHLAPDAAQAIGLDNARRFVLGDAAI